MLHGSGTLGSQPYGSLSIVEKGIIILRRRIEGELTMQGTAVRKYGVSTTINFELFEIDGIDLRTDAVLVSGDSKIMKDEGSEVNTTNNVTDEGQGYSLVLSAIEMQAARIVIYLVDSATKVWLDKAIIIETYGNASAMHAFDLDTALQDVNIQSSDDIDLTTTQKASVNVEADTALTDYGANTVVPDVAGTAPTAIENREEMDSNSTELAKISELTTQGDTNETHLTDLKGAGFAGATDSNEAIRERGDVAWITGGSDRLLMIDTTIDSITNQTRFALTSGSSDDDAYNNCTIIIEDASTSEQKAFGLVSDYVGSSKTITLKYDPAIFTMAVTDKIYILAESSLKASLPNRQLNIETDGDLTKVNLCDNTTLVDTTTTNTDMRGTEGANTTKTGYALSTAGILAIWHQLNSAIVTTGSMGKLLKDEITPVRMAILTDWINGGRLDILLDAIKAVTDQQGSIIIEFTVDTVTNTHTPTETEFQADDITEATTDHYNGRLIIFTSGALIGQMTDITAYAAVGGIGQFTVTGMTGAPVNNDTGIII